MLQHPFQCLAVTKPPGATDAYLLAACGPKVVSTGLGETPALFEWSAASTSSEASVAKPKENGERPAKKQKTTSAAPASSSVIKLTLSPDNQYAVAVTEDKIVHVLQIEEDGSLAELSQRAMPKRPCAIEVLPDNATILCGDKFGDVYSLPLLPKEILDEPDTSAAVEAEEAGKKAPLFKPSASNTTVHTKRNRKALEAQLKQKNLTPKTKEPLKFDHKLLLGHVSMLTDLTFATREVEGKERGYIITADRDEHIRVSRGPPQSHVIEGYCLGHTEYISKIRLVAGTDLLLSGGGDDWIGVWSWPFFKHKKKIDLLQPLKQALERDRKTTDGLDGLTKADNVNVSGIWIVPMRTGERVIRDESVTEPAVVVACEGVPSVLVCPVADLLAKHALFQLITLDAPILDITSSEDVAIVTFDKREAADKRVCSFRLERHKQNGEGLVQLVGDDGFLKPMERLNSCAVVVENQKALDGLLYGVSNLRKRGYQNGEEAVDVEAGAADEALDEIEGAADEAD